LFYTPNARLRSSFAPGQHGRTAGRGGGPKAWVRARSDFARQLRAKQKARRIYGVLERQFRRYYDTRDHRRGLTGLNLLQILESRLDNVVFRLGFASSRAQARLLVTHGHFTVNGRRTDVPSMLLGEGDVRSPSAKVRASLTYFKELNADTEKRNAPSWLNRDLKAMSGFCGSHAGTRRN
jgi:small subunit ribosomal protein S4